MCSEIAERVILIPSVRKLKRESTEQQERHLAPFDLAGLASGWRCDDDKRIVFTSRDPYGFEKISGYALSENVKLSIQAADSGSALDVGKRDDYRDGKSKRVNDGEISAKVHIGQPL